MDNAVGLALTHPSDSPSGRGFVTTSQPKKRRANYEVGRWITLNDATHEFGNAFYGCIRFTFGRCEPFDTKLAI